MVFVVMTICLKVMFIFIFDLEKDNVMKLKFVSLFKIFLLASFIFFVYQLIMLLEMSKVTQDSVPKKISELVLGTHEKQINLYKPMANNIFKCFQSYEEIDYAKVNDDYCDCLDGTDEPGTNACVNGIFFCKHQSDSEKVTNFVSSYKVNDGICDCCDGSDEWSNKQLLNLKRKQVKNGKYYSSCPHVCS